MNMQHVEKELTTPVLLCDQKGQLNPEAIGFARHPFIQSNLTKNFMRKKKWNDWCIFGEEILFSATISHLDYAAVCFVYILNYETQHFFEKEITIPMGHGLKMSEHVLDNHIFSHNQMKIEILYDQNKTTLSVNIPDFDGEILQAKLNIYHPPEDETLNVVVPKSRNIFHFTAKHHTLPTTGFVQWGDSKYTLHSDHSFAIFNYGRGVWSRQAKWNWAMASQRLGDRRIGLNLGGQWTDGTGMTENAIFIDGQMIKIHEDILFSYELANDKKPWIIQTKFSNHVHLTFTPFFKRISKKDMKLLHSELQQFVGYFNGYINLPGHPPLYIRQMLGCAEENITKW